MNADQTNRFYDLLDRDHAFSPSAADGFLAGVVLSPEPIPEKDWLGVVLGEQGAAAASDADCAELLDLLKRRRDEITSELQRPDAFKPLIEQDDEGKVLWHDWAGGFGKAVLFNPQSWKIYSASPNKMVADAMGGLIGMVGEASGRDALSDDYIEAFDRSGVVIIAGFVALLDHARRSDSFRNEMLDAEVPLRSGPKVGRNDHCPCGSGKKYKKCCLA